MADGQIGPSAPPGDRIPVSVRRYKLRTKTSEFRVVKLSDLTDQARDWLQSSGASTLRAKQTRDDDSVLLPSQAKSAVECAHESKVAEICFPIPPTLRAYRLDSKDELYLPLELLLESIEDADAARESLQEAGDGEIVFASLEGKGEDTASLRYDPYPSLA